MAVGGAAPAPAEQVKVDHRSCSGSSISARASSCSRPRRRSGEQVKRFLLLLAACGSHAAPAARSVPPAPAPPAIPAEPVPLGPLARDPMPVREGLDLAIDPAKDATAARPRSRSRASSAARASGSTAAASTSRA